MAMQFCCKDYLLNYRFAYTQLDHLEGAIVAKAKKHHYFL